MSKKKQRDHVIDPGHKVDYNCTVFPENTVLVIGGGASGLMAAIKAAETGAKVTLIEQNDKNGKKINATGNGRCNFTNSSWEGEVIRGSHPEFAAHALKTFSVQDTLDFFREIGVIPVEKNGYYYPASGQASSVTALLNLKARSLGVKMKSNESAKSIRSLTGTDVNGNSGQFWQVLTEGWHYEAASVILACGSCASNIMGSDGSGYELASSLGHTIIKPLPALTGLKLSGKSSIFAKWAGVRADGRVSVYVDGSLAAEERGELQLTDYGISGIPVFQVSRYAIRALDEGKKVSVCLDFVPDMQAAVFAEEMQKRMKACPYKSIEEQFLGWLPDKLISALEIQESHMDILKNLRLDVKEGLPFSNAQVAAGGVNTEEVDAYTMESGLAAGIYFAGELLDIDGTCGGYNLQWAWSSGALAGRCAAERNQK